ncbi:Rz1-like lysis system protein LysC [Phytobacter sp. V91]|uniref:Rz1-like lysis system protein LysC n=1 Tax=Phytobacter sp. V91 TaxID=3369425 RepID=UPI003F636922
MTLSGCTRDQQSQVPTLTLNTCPKVTRCVLQASNPKTQGDLSAAKDQAESDWAVCAAKVDMIVDCQEKSDEQAGLSAAGAQPVH